MKTLASFPYTEVQFTKSGTVYNHDDVNDLLVLLADQQITDLFVISHGWNNDMQEARELYKSLLTLVAEEIEQYPELTNRKFAVGGIFWPSKKFAERDLIAGGGSVSINSASTSTTNGLVAELKDLRHFFDGDDSEVLVEQAIVEAANLQTDPNAATQFVSLMQTFITRVAMEHTNEPEDYAVKNTSVVSADELLIRLSNIRVSNHLSALEGAAKLDLASSLIVSSEGGASGGSFIWEGIVNGAHNLLNYTTYYQMKKRAGQVGFEGLHNLLTDIGHAKPDCKLHLIGHSFGARVVAAATSGPNSKATLQVDTLTLLQAAFSHYGLAKEYSSGQDGLFCSIAEDRKVKGPILISYTHNDKAVGRAYAIASHLAGQSGATLGDKDDLYGGMGANGAQKSNANEQFDLDFETQYAFKAGTIYNLKADHCISDHSDICQPQVAKAIVSSISYL